MQDTKIAVKKNKFFGKFVLMVFVTSCVVILFSSIITKVRQERFHMQESKTMLEKQAAHLEAENSILDREYSALKSDPVRIEQEARNQFGYIAPDEITYSKYNFHIKSTRKKEPRKSCLRIVGRHFSLNAHFHGSSRL